MPHALATKIASLIPLVEAGLGIAFFAWMFDILRRGIFSGSDKAFNSVAHGWVRFRLGATQKDIDQTNIRLAHPDIGLANMMLSMFFVVVGLLNEISSDFSEFVETYYKPTLWFHRTLVGPLDEHIIDMLFGFLMIAVGWLMFYIEHDRVTNPGGRLARLERRMARLEALAKARAAR